MPTTQVHDVRTRLSAEQVLAVSVAIADREGLAHVSMRRLGQELSVTPMALYKHFRDKAGLLDAMAERTIGRARFEDDPGQTWEGRLRAVLSGLVALLQEHPWMGRMLVERVVPLPKYLEALEIMLDATREAGLTAEEGAVATQLAVQATVALVDDAPRGKRPTAVSVEVKAFLRDLDPTSYPNVRAAATPLSGQIAVATYYRLGIEMIVGGIGALVSGRKG